MAWTSEQYIGPGRLSLTSVQSVGHEERAVGNDQTVAVLVNVTSDNGVIIMLSKLHIRIDSTYPVASVRCVNSGANMETSISFLLAGM